METRCDVSSYSLLNKERTFVLRSSCCTHLTFCVFSFYLSLSSHLDFHLPEEFRSSGFFTPEQIKSLVDSRSGEETAKTVCHTSKLSYTFFGEEDRLTEEPDCQLNISCSRPESPGSPTVWNVSVASATRGEKIPPTKVKPNRNGGRSRRDHKLPVPLTGRATNLFARWPVAPSDRTTIVFKKKSS